MKLPSRSPRVRPFRILIPTLPRMRRLVLGVCRLNSVANASQHVSLHKVTSQIHLILVSWSSHPRETRPCRISVSYGTPTTSQRRLIDVSSEASISVENKDGGVSSDLEDKTKFLTVFVPYYNITFLFGLDYYFKA